MPLRKNRGALIKDGRLKPGLQRRRTLRKNREALIKDGRLKPGLQRRRTLRKNREALIKDGRLKPGLQRRRTLRKNREALIKDGRLKPGLQRRRTLRKNREALIKNGRLKPGLQRRRTLRKNREALIKNGRLKPGLQRRGPSRKNRGALTKNAHGPWRGNTRPDRRERRCGVAPHALRYQRGDPGCFRAEGPAVRPARARTRGKRARRRCVVVLREGAGWTVAVFWLFRFWVQISATVTPSAKRQRGPSLALRAWYRTSSQVPALVRCPARVLAGASRLVSHPETEEPIFSQAPNVVPRFRDAGASTKRFSTGLPLTSERHTNPNRKRGALAGASRLVSHPILNTNHAENRLVLG